ncbi:hypothetical protein EG329_007012 [Mollisiaceae sp. DMI_Dod_QoI]|nr:hypothetical protein EG329_007012 [Helotiales sp. DMI_Dod_QoI]
MTSIEWTVQRRLESTDTPIIEIASCALAGVRDIILVVGNDDDACEVILIPLTPYMDMHTPCEKGATLEAEQLRAGLLDHWREKMENGDTRYIHCPPPSISVMAVKRKPLQPFTKFPQLPTEVQEMVWKYSISVPRVLTLLGAYRQPSLFSVCRNSRRIALAQVYTELPGQTGWTIHYNAERDTVRLEALAWWGTQLFPTSNLSLGLPFSLIEAESFSAQEAKRINGLREIVVLQGERFLNYEMQLIPNTYPPCASESEADRIEASKIQSYINDLLKEIDKVLKRWKLYQRRREKEGKSSPDWTVPTVRAARLRIINNVESPYTS